MTSPIRNSPIVQLHRIQSALSRAREQIAATEEQIYTGRKINRPSDAPATSVRIDQLRAAQADQAGYAESASRATALLDTADQALGTSTDVIKRAWEIAVQMSSELHSPQNMANAALEVENLREQMVSLANTEFAGRHVFAGNAYDQAAFDASGAYLGSSDEPAVQVSNLRRLQNGFDGEQIFKSGIDVFTTLDDLIKALNDGDHVQVQWLLPPLKEAVEQLTSARQKVGELQVAADDAAATAQSLDLLFTGQLTDEVATDPAEAFTKLAELRTTYEASLAVAAQSMGVSLFDYLS